MRKLLVFLVLAIAACQNPVEVTHLDGRPLTPGELVRAVGFYRQTAKCLNLDDASQHVQWWIVTAVTYDGDEKRGVQDRDSIYILDKRMWDPRLWRHESMHHILWRGTGASDSRHEHRSWESCTDLGVFAY